MKLHHLLLLAALSTLLIGGASAANQLVTWPNEGTTGGCDASCTLEDAINDVGAGETIWFQPNVTVIERTGTLAISKDVTIDGNWSVTIQKKDGAGDFRGLTTSGNVIVDELWVRNFTLGGVLADAGTFTNQGNITGNSGDIVGGGIRGADGVPIVNRGSIHGNSATGSGGGMYGKGAAATNHGTITENQAPFGAGMFSESPGNTLTNFGNVSRNTASTRGGGMYATSSIITNHGMVYGNTAQVAGGISVDVGSTGINHGSITANQATGNMASDGGGVYTRTAIKFTNYGTITGNHAARDGGGVAAVFAVPMANHGTITGNTAGDEGGGLYANGVTHLVNGTIHGNQATGGDANQRLAKTTQLTGTGGAGSLTATNQSALTASTSYRVGLLLGTDCSPGGVGETGATKYLSNATTSTNSTGALTHTFNGLSAGTYVVQLHEMSGDSVSDSHVYSECVTVTAAPTGPATGSKSEARCPITQVHAKTFPPDTRHEVTFCRNNPIHSATFHYDHSAAPRVTTYQYEPGDLPDVPPEGWVASSYGLELTVSPSPSDGSITFKVPAEDVAGLDPSRLVVVHFNEGEWNAVATTIVDDPSSTLLVTMDLTGLSYSPFWLMEAPESLVDADLSSDSSSEPSDESVAVPGPNAFALLLGLTIAATIRSRRALR